MNRIPVILYYGVEQDAKLQAVCREQHIRLKRVSEKEYGLTLLQVLLREDEGGARFHEEMLVLAGFTEEQLDAVLKALRSAAVTGLKAVLTMSNGNWTSEQLYQELCRERAQFIRK